MTLQTLTQILNKYLKDNPQDSNCRVLVRRDITSEELAAADIHMFPKQGYIALGSIRQMTPKALASILFNERTTQ